MIDDIFAINLYHFPFIPAFVYNEVIDKRRKKSEKKQIQRIVLIRFLGGKTSYYVLGIVILLALIIYFFPSDLVYIQACRDHYRYYLAPIIVCTDLVLSFWNQSSNV